MRIVDPNNDKIFTKPNSKKTSEPTDKYYKITLVVLAVFALIIAYLFALNGRYEIWKDDILFDKWTQKSSDLYESFQED